MGFLEYSISDHILFLTYLSRLKFLIKSNEFKIWPYIILSYIQPHMISLMRIEIRVPFICSLFHTTQYVQVSSIIYVETFQKVYNKYASLFRNVIDLGKVGQKVSLNDLGTT